jgi:hypothetical protein
MQSVHVENDSTSVPLHQALPSHAPKNITADLDTANIIEGKHERCPSQKYVHLTTLETVHENCYSWENTFSAFSTMISPPNPASIEPQLYQIDLPPPPNNWKKMLAHPLADEFKKAAQEEWDAIMKRKIYKKMPAIERYNAGTILPLRWVFAYKLDSSGNLIKCKARIVVRGDLQPYSSIHSSKNEAAATTLAARTFCALMALTTAKNCDTAQLDAVSAYLNSNLDETIYCEFPEGFESADGTFLLLFLALYRLRCSGKLWQDNLTRKMLALGLRQVPEEPCLFTTSQSAEIVDTLNPNLSTAIRANVASTGADEHIVQVIIFFYVDDIVMICSPNEAS